MCLRLFENHPQALRLLANRLPHANNSARQLATYRNILVAALLCSLASWPPSAAGDPPNSASDVAAQESNEDAGAGIVVLEFPPDEAVGVVHTRPARSNDDLGDWYADWARLGPAQGRLEVPERHQVRLDVSKAGSQQAQFLSHLPRDSIDYLSLRGTDLTDAGLPHVATLTGLRVLDLDSTRIKGDGLEIKALSSLVQLEELRLSAFNVHKDGFGVGDRAMSAIAALPKLRSVRLRLTRVTDAGLAKLCKSKSLRTIGLEGTAVSDAGLVHLKQLPDLENLQLGVYRDGARVTDEGLKTIGQLNNLRYLDLSGTKVTNAGLVHLRPLERLESLSLENTEVTEVGLAALHPLKSLTRLRFYERVTDVGAEHLSKLASLKNISSNMEITDDGVAKLAQLRHLEELSLSEGGITNEATKHIANMESLIGLWFQDCPITDEGLGRLTALRNLERLMLHGTKVTGEGLRHLGSLPKLEWLSLDFGSTEPEETPAISLKHLEGLGSLTYLTIGNPIASAKGVLAGELQHVSKLKNLETFEVDENIILNNQIVGYLAGLTNLESLRIDASTITDEGLAFLSGMQRLKYLTISCQVTDAGLAELNKLKSLRMLQIASPDVTKEGLEALERQMPSLQDVNHFTYRLHGQKVSRSVSDDFWRVGAPEDRPIKDVLEGNSPPEIAASKWLNAQSGDMTWDKLDGKVVLLSFWNQRVRPCRDDIPMLKRLNAKFGDDGLVILSIHTTRNADQIEDFAKQQQMTWPVAVDQEQQTTGAFRAGLREFYLVDRTGQMRMAGIFPDDLERAIQMLIDEGPHAN